MLPEKKEELINETINFLETNCFIWESRIHLFSHKGIKYFDEPEPKVEIKFDACNHSAKRIIDRIELKYILYPHNMSQIIIYYLDGYKVECFDTWKHYKDKYYQTLIKHILKSLERQGKSFDNIKDILTAQVDKMAEVSKQDILNMFVEDYGGKNE